MDFNIGNLVSSAIGAVVKVATAVVNTVSSVISGIAGMFEAAFGSLESAVSGAMAAIGVVDVDEDGELDMEDAEEFLEEKFKVLVGAFIVSFGSDPSVSNSQSYAEDSDGVYLNEFNIPIQVTDGAAVTYDKDGGPSEQKSVWECVLGLKDSISNSSIGEAINKSYNSIKGIACDAIAENKKRADKAFDSKYDFYNWITIGIPESIRIPNAERSEKAFDSGYDFANWASSGSVDMIKETFASEDPLSKEHWMNSFGTASILFGVRGNKPVAGKAMIGESNLKRADIRSLPTKIPYEFMDNTVEHIFNGKIEKAGTPSEYATGWHYQAGFNPKGNKIIQILEQADEYGTIIADVEIRGIPKQDASSFFSNKFTTNEVADMIGEAHMTKQKVFGTRNCYRGVAANGMTIEMFLAGDGTNIKDIITAYPKHTSTLP